MQAVRAAMLVLVAATVSGRPSERPHGYKDPAKPYNFAYGVSDPYQGIDFGQKEESDGHQVQGTYQIQLPDGRKQIVTYYADHENGFHADVSYKGEAQYPPKSEHPPFIVPPSKGYDHH